MALADLFPAADGIIDLAPADKADLLGLLAGEAGGRLDNRRDDILAALQAREKLGSTALGRGIALPHARLDWLDRPMLILARLHRPIDFDSRDGEPVDLVFLVLWPEAASEGFLPALSGICRAMRGDRLPRQLRQAASAQAALAKLHAADEADPDEPS